ncbi:MAG: MipA/OmpV family protein [Burkholderiales bacterium]
MSVSRQFVILLFGVASGPSPLAFAQKAGSGEAHAGLGLRVRPAYEGAESRRGQAIPYLRFYREHFFARTTQGMLEAGVRAEPLARVVFGAQLAYEDGRLSDESAFLRARNFEDIDPGASAGAHAEIDWNAGPMPLNALVRYRRHFDSDLGAQADLRLTAGIYSRGRVKAGVYGQLTWSDDKAMRSYFGVSAQESAVSGLPQYAAGAGLRFAEAGLLGAVDLSKRWLMLWGANARRLQANAGDSPIVQKSTNWYVNAGAACRF